jgi:hypothetical protein
MAQSQPFESTPSLWGDETERPHCPQCEMRMITVRAPPPAKYECLRCNYSQPAALNAD